jgi:hypothetical protein
MGTAHADEISGEEKESYQPVTRLRGKITYDRN